MKRSQITRRSVGRRNRKPLPKRSRRRQARRAAVGVVYGPYFRWAKKSGRTCLLTGVAGHVCIGPIDPHHVIPVGRGIERGGVDTCNLVLLCRGAHTLSELSVHRMGRPAFEEYWAVDLDWERWALWAEYAGSASNTKRTGRSAGRRTAEAKNTARTIDDRDIPETKEEAYVTDLTDHTHTTQSSSRARATGSIDTAGGREAAA